MTDNFFPVLYSSFFFSPAFTGVVSQKGIRSKKDNPHEIGPSEQQSNRDALRINKRRNQLALLEVSAA
jgi:hypothetical protein